MRHIFSYVVTRVLLAIPMVFIMLTLVFVVLRIMPGDPVSAMLGGQAPQKVIDQKKEELGLNKPIAAQYVDYLGQLARLDLGKSMIFNQDVSQPIIEKLPATLELTLFGLLVSLGIGIPLGHPRRGAGGQAGDFGIRLYANVAYCLPVFWLGLMLQLIFSVLLRWFPVAGRTGARVDVSGFSWSGFYIIDTLRSGDLAAFGDVMWHLVLPAVTLGVVLSGIFVRLTRANMLDVLKSDYILAARARGIPERRVVYNHGLRNALIPIVTMLGLQFSLLLAGAILTESTFSWPGMGRLLLERISLRDYPTIQGVIVVYTLFVSGMSLLVDLLYAVIDPRVKYWGDVMSSPSSAPRTPSAARFSPAGAAARFFRWVAASGRKYRTEWWIMIAGIVVIVFIALMTLAPALFTRFNPNDQNAGGQMTPPSAGHIMGTDNLSRDVWARVVYGAQTILGVAIAAALVSAIIGIPLGLLSGFAGGVFDRVLSLIMDSVYSFPGLILAIAFAAMLGPGVVNITLAVAVVYIPTYFRLVRGQTLSIKEEMYVEAARAIGARRGTILARYVFPNVIATVVVILSLNIADAIMTEAALSYIGLGLPAGIPDWGMDLSMGKKFLPSGVWWMITFPGVMIMLLALGFTMLGEGLAEILNPRLLER